MKEKICKTQLGPLALLFFWFWWRLLQVLFLIHHNLNVVIGCFLIGLFQLVTWKLGSLVQKGQSGKPGKKQMLKWKCFLLLPNWIFLLLAKWERNFFIYFIFIFCPLPEHAFIIHYAWFLADLHNLLSEAQETAVLTRSRIIRMPAFCPWWYTF